MPKRAQRNAPAPPIAESSSLSASNFISTAPLKEAAQEQGDGSCAPESSVRRFYLVKNGF